MESYTESYFGLPPVGFPRSARPLKHTESNSFKPTATIYIWIKVVFHTTSRASQSGPPSTYLWKCCYRTHMQLYFDWHLKVALPTWQPSPFQIRMFFIWVFCTELQNIIFRMKISALSNLVLASCRFPRTCFGTLLFANLDIYMVYTNSSMGRKPCWVFYPQLRFTRNGSEGKEIIWFKVQWAPKMGFITQTWPTIHSMNQAMKIQWSPTENAVQIPIQLYKSQILNRIPRKS